MSAHLKGVRAVILGAGRGTRYLDPTRSFPTSLQNVGDGGRVLDWILHAMDSVGIALEDTVFVGGYHLEKVVQGFPGLRYYFHQAWDREHDGGALLQAQSVLEGPCLVCSTDVVFRSPALQLLADARGDVVVAGHGPDDAALPLALLRGHGLTHLKLLLGDSATRQNSLAALLRHLSQQMEVTRVDVGSHVAEMRDPSSLARFALRSKAQTLEGLRPLVKKARVLDQVRFTVEEWERAPQKILNHAREHFGRQHVVVRSSASTEDSWSTSNAGRFTSVLDVSTTPEPLQQAIQTVIAAYHRDTDAASFRRSEVFVQPHLSRVAASGVMLTRDLETGAPYRVITLDRTTGKTNSVTSGDASPVETLIVFRGLQHPPADPLVTRLLELAQELEQLVGHDSLDVEFAADQDGQLYLFQVRPLLHKHPLQVAESDFVDEVQRIAGFVEEQSAAHARLKGQGTLLSNMSDWNPAEMIGTVPRPLALSLYQVLITDSAWARARQLMGYHDAVGEPLLVALGGLPYIDVRASLNSLTPASLPDDIRAQVVNASLKYLAANPSLHDKIEFDVGITCLALDWEHQSRRFLDLGVPAAVLSSWREALLHLTDRVLQGKQASPQDQLKALEVLDSRRQAELATRPSVHALPRSIRRLLVDAVDHGTVPFSVLARGAFISMSMLKSLVRCGVLELDEYHAILNGIPTVASEISDKLLRVRRGEITREEFASFCGHLRPGTYDITSPNYLQMLDALTSGRDVPANPADRHPPASAILERKRAAVDKAMREQGFTAHADDLFGFIQATLPGRERAKFEFTKNVNAALELLALYGASMELGREELSFVSIERFMRMATDSPSNAARTELSRTAAFEAKRHQLACSLRLPPLLASARDVEFFRQMDTQPNFITHKRVSAMTVDVDAHPAPDELKGRIAVIRSADPGHDWIFSCGIAGLITQFGGAASHMAIRAAEFGLPAVIGCGEARYTVARKAARLEIDCAAQTIRVLP